ncbi:low affinity iron permease family protein [Rhizobium sp. C1]|uniref:low affinity iron permease family protein n=1 Tax=Rhizobium sp. C1 TaxID=1349799 RepID=UPI001E4C1847|nr:low affinity iron permease family protein [Rhizobium sp. C1]MCD2177220.1 low affinity iron permease family protein [Rhizobium sp. C1]
MADVTKLFSKFATKTSKLAGKPATFVLAVTLVVAWAVTGPLFGFSDVWQLVINTSTTIITFLMIFVLQNSQNRDSEAIQAKLDELILVGAAHNRLIGAEKLDEHELDKLKKEIEAQAEEIGEEPEELAEKIGLRR